MGLYRGSNSSILPGVWDVLGFKDKAHNSVSSRHLNSGLLGQAIMMGYWRACHKKFTWQSEFKKKLLVCADRALTPVRPLICWAGIWGLGVE